MDSFLDILYEATEWVKWVIFTCLLAAFYKGITSRDTPIDWWEFVATRGVDGKPHADIDKLGKMFAIIVSSYVVIRISATVRLTGTEFIALVGVWLTFAGAVAGWGAYLRAKAGIATTTVTTEPAQPAAPPTKTTTTTTEPAITAPAKVGTATITADTAIVNTGDTKS